MSKRKHHKKQEAKPNVSFDLPIVYVCYVCGNESNKPLLWISKHNRSIMYFLCSDYCYREINGS